ncbi:MAG: LLM class F420-dependent oxidoreductase, partial [Candidatus Binatia bacterium]
MNTTAVEIVPRGKIGCGLVLPIVAQSRLIGLPWEASGGPEEILRVARECDRQGFLYLGVCDHVCI